MSGTQETRTYSVTEVAQILGLSKAGVHNAVNRGEFPSFKVGVKVLIPREAIHRLLGGGGEKTTAQR